MAPEFVGDNVKWARGKIPGQGVPGSKTCTFVRKNRPFPGQNELQTNLSGLKRFLPDKLYFPDLG